jgi:hypothetical protein
VREEFFENSEGVVADCGRAGEPSNESGGMADAERSLPEAWMTQILQFMETRDAARLCMRGVCLSPTRTR